jgi:hypothetical protein
VERKGAMMKGRKQINVRGARKQWELQVYPRRPLFQLLLLLPRQL